MGDTADNVNLIFKKKSSQQEEGTPIALTPDASEPQKPSLNDTKGRGRKRSIVWDHFTMLKCEPGQ